MVAVLIINILFGWTLIGWVLALVIAISDKTRTAAITNALASRNMIAGMSAN
jgi:hypothetical protein